MIRVLLADDHQAVREALAELLANCDDVDVVGTASDGETAISLADSCTPDVVLMDINMPGIGGIEATRRITADWPHTRVIMFTAFSDRGHIADAMAAGATGFVAKGDDPVNLVREIRRAAG